MDSDERESSESEDHLQSRQWFIFGEPKNFFASLDALGAHETPLSLHLQAFRQNLASALVVGNIPFQMANASEMDLRFDRIHSSERIRALKKVEAGQKLAPAHEQEAFEIAQRRMREELSDVTVVDQLARLTLGRLHAHRNDLEFDESCRELLRQVLVMSWGAFETIANDVVRTVLNMRPSLMRAACKVRPYKNVLSTTMLLDALEAAQFNLSNKLGDFLSDLAPIDGVEKNSISG